jgi:ribosomal protein S18 acetylase RimI-like enzyme
MLVNRIFKIVKQRVLYDFMLETVGRKIVSRKGLVVRPYYVFREGLLECNTKDYDFVPKNYQISFLSAEDVQSLDQVEGRFVSAHNMQDKLKRGYKCLGLKIEGHIAAFTWWECDVFPYPPTKEYALKENEAYLFDMYVLRAYRGMNLASLLRYICYKELAKIGRTALYSVSDVSNRPAIRFKKKLNAKTTGLYLYIRIGKKSRWKLKLKTYND